ncbi:MAG: hypothetical protein ABSF23_13020 [Terracidiphilus sp.]|jgi:hypothetical protein
MAVLSVDLAHRRWSELGIVILRHMPLQEANPPSPDVAPARAIECEIVPLGPLGLDPALDRGPVDPEILAGRLNHLCAVRGIRVLLLDGPQAWKSRANGLEVARGCERRLNTPAKAGLSGILRPYTYRRFAEFCMDVYDALGRRGWRRLETGNQPLQPRERVLVESDPRAAWKSLGLKPLPAKSRAHGIDLPEAFAALRSVVPLTADRPPNHDQLQAIVGGLPGLALEEHDPAYLKIVGKRPRREDGQWREGFIVLPALPHPATKLRSLH